MRAFVTGATGFPRSERERPYRRVVCPRREVTTLGAMIDRVSPRRVRLTIPAPLLKAMIPAGPLIGKLMDTGPNLRELISASAGVTYWATDAKARAELGYEPRSLEAGL